MNDTDVTAINELMDLLDDQTLDPADRSGVIAELSARALVDIAMTLRVQSEEQSRR